MEVQVLLWLLLLHYPLKADATCQHGNIRLVGIVQPNYVAGRMELCDGEGMWRKICAEGWDRNDAKVACRQMGFPNQDVRNSYYGRSSLTQSFRWFRCTGNERNLIDCRNTTDNRCINNNNAGVECTSDRLTEIVTETFPRYVATTNSITLKEQMVTTVTERGQCTQVVPSITVQTSCPPSMQAAAGTGHPQAKEYNCAALSGGLGALAALMAVGMVGVALGWAWSYHI